ncbi:hypothetical protein D3C87_915040 [compost metagenome]
MFEKEQLNSVIYGSITPWNIKDIALRVRAGVQVSLGDLRLLRNYIATLPMMVSNINVPPIVPEGTIDVTSVPNYSQQLLNDIQKEEDIIRRYKE